MLVLMLLFAMHRFQKRASKEVKRWSMLFLLSFDLVHGVTARVAAGTSGRGEDVLNGQDGGDVEKGDNPLRGVQVGRDNEAGALAEQRPFSGE